MRQTNDYKHHKCREETGSLQSRRTLNVHVWWCHTGGSVSVGGGTGLVLFIVRDWRKKLI